MLKKLLKYDMRSIFKLWWIGALTSLASAAVGGSLFKVIEKVPDETESLILNLITIFSSFAIIICVLAMSLSMVMTTVLVIVRFYKHFFTDEGYLTFTLPTARATLLFSKTVNALIWHSLHFVVLLASLFIFAALAMPAEDIEFFSALIKELFESSWYSWGGWVIVYIFEGLLLLIACLALSITLIQFCITFASTLLKKARAVVAIAIYYGITSAFSLISQFVFFLFGFALTEAMPVLFEDTLGNQAVATISVLILVIIAIISAMAAILYSITQYLLDRKLNLA